jgi:enoyl-[acyl-carrier protein] reductase III
MLLNLEGKLAFVTGGSRGIGRAIALRLAEAGADVAINYFRQRGPAEEVAEQIEGTGRRVLLLKGNVAKEEHLDRMFGEIGERWGGLDILVSNAASGVLKPVMELTVHHWHWTMDINAMALVPMAQRAVPLMRGRPGRIIAISSLGGQRAIPNYAAVGASKGALESLVRHLAVELAPLGVQVNAVSAGTVDTDALKHFPNRDELLDESLRRTPSGRLTTPEDVAHAILYFCSPLSDQVVGQVLVVDGGYSIVA